MIVNQDVKRLVLGDELIEADNILLSHDIERIDRKYYWLAVERIRQLVDEISLNYLVEIGYLDNKNSEKYRALYRYIGYSLYGYWEIFYWKVNNEKAHLYVPNSTEVPSAEQLIGELEGILENRVKN